MLRAFTNCDRWYSISRRGALDLFWLDLNRIAGTTADITECMAQDIDSLGIIAGNRSLPLLLARQARSMGVKRLVAVAFENETDPELVKLVDQIVWIKVGQLSKMISAFTSHGVSRCVMVGQIAPKNLFDLRPDFRAMALLLKLKEKNAQTIFGAIAEELKRDGVALIEE